MPSPYRGKIMNYKEISPIIFPEPSNLNINMMPIVMGDESSVPDFAKSYTDLINKCNFKRGTTIYLTVNEDIIERGTTQRRPGIHTDGIKINGKDIGWGGGTWGGQDGIYLASTDGACKIWDCQTYDVDYMGEIKAMEMPGDLMKPNILYWITDRTPHEALPSSQTTMRQFFRLVSEDIGIWWSKHSTHNPLGVKAKSYISYEDKFKHGN